MPLPRRAPSPRGRWPAFAGSTAGWAESEAEPGATIRKRGPESLTQVPVSDGSPDVTLTEPGVVWDQFPVFAGHRGNSPYIRIGHKGRERHAPKVRRHANALKQARHYRDLLDSGQVDSQTHLARLTDTPRSTISAYMRLLGLPEEVQAEALQIGDSDPRARHLTEARLRHLHGLKDPHEAFQAVLAGERVR